MVLLSATMPAEVLDVTKKFMREPIRILVKKEELTLEGIKQFYINVEREVGLINQNHLSAVNIKRPFSLKHPAKTAGAEPLRFSSCGRVSMGTPGKKIKGTALKMRLGGTSFLMSSVLCLEILCYTITFFE